ncbi:uncharacterized protein NECHADRAFT_75673 [Fusarium vanettenii 77-13-4]|uniref:Uncharacterized protein n=1 Tax=Fusarium vanettenii (strain ATCC MYA-4622 / CBS 123669 / FGSC 9596 / NRRL 45880 / 77-13-4) TaxID=660122 RepID=C7YJG8_FUSV7|nr:uncharacterized protein NECHADRAFT_75673 [Fusarium vanettenii 77-13-4]EEU48276.1 hypothetical protein NECHADRAFT_75673 [Fusarium vanettenii 77-13-4]
MTDNSPDCVPLKARVWDKSKNDWRDETITPTQLHGSNILPVLQSDSHVVVIFADADKVRECPSCRRCFTTQFQMPQLWWSNYAKKSNGHFGCETFRDAEGTVTSLNAWSRYLVKQLHEDGHYWYKFNTLTRWIASSYQTILLVFESEKQSKLSELIPKGLLDGSHTEPHHDPFWVHVRLLEELSDLQNNAVWTVRTEIRKVEKKEQRSKPDPNYRSLHDLARHAIHVSETLDVSLKTVKSIVEQHKTLEEETWRGGKPKNGSFRQVRERLFWYEHTLESLKSRALSNKERLINEIQLSFNLVAQYDSAISVQIGQATQSDSAAMKTIAFATLTFLPATFISAVFSMSFFNIDDDTGEWSVSNKFWIYWVIAIPVTLLTAGGWYSRRIIAPPLRIGEEERRANKFKKLKKRLEKSGKDDDALEMV